MLTVTVRHHFSAGHRIPGLPGPGGKCSNLHGHTFGVAWTFQVPDATAQDVEFASIKATLRQWVNAHLDHGYIIDRHDTQIVNFLRANNFKHHLIDGPPTTEAIATVIADATRAILDAPLANVQVTEGPHNAATWHAKES